MHGLSNTLFLDFEERTFPDHYKEYYGAKRNNFFATIEAARSLWDSFMLLDEIWMRELQNMRTVIDTSRMFPLILFMNAHAKVRIAIEVAFSACLPEAHSLFRDAIESVAHGHRLFSDPELQKLWLSRDESQEAIERFKDEFWHSKEDKLFQGLPELYKLWKQYSDWGSHTNPASLFAQFSITETDKHIRWQRNYTGVDPRTLIPTIFTLLIAFHAMERILFDDCKDRLQFDQYLCGLRVRFDGDKERLRQEVIREFKIPRPAVRSTAV